MGEAVPFLEEPNEASVLARPRNSGVEVEGVGREVGPELDEKAGCEGERDCE